MGETKNKTRLPLFRGISTKILPLLYLFSGLPLFLSAQDDVAVRQAQALDELLRAEDAAFLTELDRLIAGTTSVSGVHQLLGRYLDDTAAGAFHGALSRRKAHLYELQGNFEAGKKTLAALDDEALFGGPDPAAVDLARLEVELGEFASAEARLERLTGRQVTRPTLREITTLRCRISLAKEHRSSFDSCIETLEREGWQDLSLALRLQWARETGDDEEAERITAALKGEFPLMWESLTTTEGRVSRYPSPALLLSGGANLGEGEPAVSEAVSTPGDEAASTPRGVQVGSFRDRENAEYMARDVGELGFDVSIRTREHRGGTFYQVLVSPGEATAQNTVVRLKEHGFEGFLVFD